MDSVPAAAGRPHLGVLTALAGLVLLAFVVLLLWLSWGRPRVEDVAEPARALALVVSRTLDLDEAVAGVPAWERRLWALAFNDRGQDLAEGLAWYAELAAVSRDPQVDLHLAVLEAEAGHLERVRRTLEEWQRRGGTFARWADLVGVAYLGATPDPARTPGLGAALGRLGGGDWFSDRLALRWAERTGDAALTADAAARCSSACAGSWRRRSPCSPPAAWRSRWSRAGAVSSGSAPPSCRRRGAGAPGSSSSCGAGRSRRS